MLIIWPSGNFNTKRRGCDYSCRTGILESIGYRDLVIINPIYFHEILSVKGNTSRITLGLFLVFSKYGHNVVTWS